MNTTLRSRNVDIIKVNAAHLKPGMNLATGERVTAVNIDNENDRVEYTINSKPVPFVAKATCNTKISIQD